MGYLALGASEARSGLGLFGFAVASVLYSGLARAEEELARVEEEEETPIGSPVEVHGFVSQGFIKSTANNYLARSKRGSFEFAEAGLNFTKTLTDELRVGMQLFVRDLGPIGNYAPHFDWFYLDYHFWDWLGIRAGRTKLPFGLYNETSDIDAARVPILLPQSVYSVQSRDFLLAQTGGELYGDMPMGQAGRLEYRAYGGTIFLDTTSMVSSSSSVRNLSVPYLFGGRLMWQTPLDGLQVGGSVQALRLDFDVALSPELLAQLAAAGRLPADFSDASTIRVRLPALLSLASIEYAIHDLLLSAEYSRWRIEFESALPALVPESHTVSERFYGMASYRVIPWFTPGVYYSVLFPNTEQRSGRQAYQHDVAATLRFDINSNWLLKLEGHFMHGTAGLDPALNGNAPRNTLTEDWGLLLVKTTAYF